MPKRQSSKMTHDKCARLEIYTIPKCNVLMWTVIMRKCESAKIEMRQCDTENPKVLKYQNARLRKCDGVNVREYENATMRKCENVNVENAKVQ